MLAREYPDWFLVSPSTDHRAEGGGPLGIEPGLITASVDAPSCSIVVYQVDDRTCSAVSILAFGLGRRMAIEVSGLMLFGAADSAGFSNIAIDRVVFIRPDGDNESLVGHGSCIGRDATRGVGGMTCRVETAQGVIDLNFSTAKP